MSRQPGYPEKAGPVALRPRLTTGLPFRSTMLSVVEAVSGREFLSYLKTR